MKSIKDSRIVRVYFEANSGSSKQNQLEIKDLKQIFRPFGEIRRIMIYCRTEMIKAFIEFDLPLSAEIAIRQIHATKINNLGIAKVFPSNKKHLILENEHIEFEDFTLKKSNKTFSLKKHALEYELSSKQTTTFAEEQISNEFSNARKIIDTFKQNEDTKP